MKVGKDCVGDHGRQEGRLRTAVGRNPMLYCTFRCGPALLSQSSRASLFGVSICQLREQCSFPCPLLQKRQDATPPVCQLSAAGLAESRPARTGSREVGPPRLAGPGGRGHKHAMLVHLVALVPEAVSLTLCVFMDKLDQWNVCIWLSPA